jgi:peptide chain release factor
LTIYPVSEAKNRQLEEKIKALGLKESDFVESFVRSQGAGGQNVNKVSSCVVLRHLPTGLTVKCQRERSQALNRFLARRQLVEMIEARVKGIASKRVHAAEKIRRQKRRRSRRAKNKMLDDKRHHAVKKQLRQRPAD